MSMDKHGQIALKYREGVYRV